MPVQKVQSDEEFGPIINGAGGKLVVIDFYADWCGPCKAIAPYFEELSNTYSDACFVKVNTQTCDKIAESFRVKGIPYFVLMRKGTMVDSLTGANKEELKNKIEKALEQGENQTSSGNSKELYGIKGQDLSGLIDKSKSECLNEDDEHPWTNAVIDHQSFAELKSDCDEQLLLTVEFQNPVKIYGIKIAGSPQCPNKLRIYSNQTMSLDFDKAESGKPTYDCDVEKTHITEDGPAIELPKLKFANVRNITIFIPANHANDDVTSIKQLLFIGQSVGDSTDMTDFKRVAGKAGESH